MPNTYTQVHIQFVFAVKYRKALIQTPWEYDLHKYITGIVQTKHKMLAINTMPDHLHMLVGFRTTQSMADFMMDVKTGSTNWINKNQLTTAKFEWQDGYGAFSYSKSHVPNVIDYIHHQQLHHQKKTFLQEYTEFLEKFGVDYDPAYIFKAPI